MTVPTIMLNDGRQIPQLGFGVFQIPPEETAAAVRTALEVGYRHLDTAQMYGNEAETLQGVLDSGVPREEVWITSKLSTPPTSPTPPRPRWTPRWTSSAVRSTSTSSTGPLPTLYGGDFVSTWKVLEEARADGRLKSIGVSNFQVPAPAPAGPGDDGDARRQPDRGAPYFGNEEVRSYCGEHQIGVEAWSPIAQGRCSTTGDHRRRRASRQVPGPDHAALAHRARRHRLPKSVTRSRVEENFDLFDIELTEEDLALITALDQGADGRIGGHPDTMDYVPS